MLGLLCLSRRFHICLRHPNSFKRIVSARMIKVPSTIPHQVFQPRNMTAMKTDTLQTALRYPAVREDPVVEKIDTVLFRNIFTDELRTLISIFKKYNYELRIAGGAVRDILMNIIPKDIDLATTATPEQMKFMFKRENVRLINTRGEEHGTITARINDKENFEITTLRIDTRTDGRHAQVEFTTDWQLDAGRRDLTINSMFLGFDGRLYDYFYGYDDLERRRVLFVGDANSRIKEDFLRILRYFRFYGRITYEPTSHDEETLQAIRSNCIGLARISGERIWSELQKILLGKHSGLIMLEMMKCGLAPYCGLPIDPNMEEFQRLCMALDHFPPPHYPILYMIALMQTPTDIQNLHARLKLSAFDRDLGLFITQNREKVDTEFITLFDFKKLCMQTNVKQPFVLELLKYSNKMEFYRSLKDWVMPHFPINGRILQENGIEAGMEMGMVMSELKTIWAESDFKFSGEDLLDLYLADVKKRVDREMKLKNREKKRKTK